MPYRGHWRPANIGARKPSKISSGTNGFHAIAGVGDAATSIRARSQRRRRLINESEVIRGLLRAQMTMGLSADTPTPLGSQGVRGHLCKSMRDRKSTRLNSHHNPISYGVF